MFALMMKRLINRRQQGDLGEASAVEWLTRLGAVVAVPLGHSPHFDLVAQMNGSMLRIQVKASAQEIRTPQGYLRFPVSLVTCGGNQSWNGVRKLFDASEIDYLFALTAGGRRWFIPVSDLEARGTVQLGGPRYSEYEIEPTGAIRPLVYGSDTSLDSASPGEYPSGQRTAAVNRLALPSEVRILPPPSDSADSGPVAIGRTKLSSHFQVAVPRAVAAASAVAPGDRFRVESDGPGRFVMTRIEEYMDRTPQLPLSD
jgi:hypothetical protein